MNPNTKNWLRDFFFTAVMGPAFISAIGTVHAQMMSIAAEEQAAGEQRETVGFDRVQPILRKRCQSCHNPEELRGDLSVTDMSALQAGSSSGPVVVAKKPRESLLYTTAAHLDEPKMPPNSRKIPGRELEVIRRWIEDGLVAKSGMKPPAVEGMKTRTDEEKYEPGVRLQTVSPVLQSTSIAALAAHPSSGKVAFAGNRQIVFLDATTAELTGAIPFPEPEITALRFSRDGSLLIAAGGVPGLSGAVRGFDTKTGQEVFKVLDENDSILGLDLSPNDQLLAVGGPSKVMRIANVSGEVQHTFRKPTDWVLTNRFSPDGLLVATGDRFGGLFVSEAESGELFWNLRGHTGAVHSIAWDSDQETLLSAGEDGTIRVWNMHHGDQTAQWNAGVGGVLALSRSMSLTVAGGRNGLVTAWHSPESQAGSFQADDQIESLELLPEQDRLVAADASGRIHVLSLPNLKLITSLMLPQQKQVMDDLLARLEDRKTQFEASEQARFAEEERLSQLAESTTSKAAPTTSSIDSTTLSDLNSREYAGDAEISSALEAALHASQAMVSQQATLLEGLKTQRTKLDKQIESQEELVASNRDQIERLESILAAMRGGPHAMQIQALRKQVSEQNAILAVLSKLEQQGESAAKQAERLPKQSRPDWTSTLEILSELTQTLETESKQTEQQLRGLTAPTEMLTEHVAAEAKE